MLPWYPMKICRNRNANKATVLYKDLSFRVDAILEACSKPSVDVTRNVNSCSGDEVIPMVFVNNCIIVLSGS